MSGQHFLPVPASLSHLDLRDIQAALIDTHANVYSAASALGVPAADLRRLTRAHPQLIDIAIEAGEQQLDLAERNLDEALHCDDPRRRDAVSMFFVLRKAWAQRAAGRGGPEVRSGGLRGAAPASRVVSSHSTIPGVGENRCL